MLKNFKLGTRLIILFLIVGVAPFSVIGLLALSKASNSLEQQAGAQMRSVLQIKKERIEAYFRTIEGMVITFSEDIMIQDAMRVFKDDADSFAFENDLDDDNLAAVKAKVADYYRTAYADAYRQNTKGALPDLDGVRTLKLLRITT